MGAVLLQGEGERLRPIAFFSSGLTESQKKYSAGELECWALIAASRKFRKYLQATNKVHFISDHNPLRWLRRQKDPRHKFARWIQELESFDYEIQYVQGSANSVADYLSHLDSEVDLDVNNEDEYFERHIFSISDGELDIRYVTINTRTLQSPSQYDSWKKMALYCMAALRIRGACT